MVQSKLSVAFPLLLCSLPPSQKSQSLPLTLCCSPSPTLLCPTLSKVSISLLLSVALPLLLRSLPPSQKSQSLSLTICCSPSPTSFSITLSKVSISLSRSVFISLSPIAVGRQLAENLKAHCLTPSIRLPVRGRPFLDRITTSHSHRLCSPSVIVQHHQATLSPNTITVLW